MHIHETIKHKRKEQNLTQEALAGMLGVTKAAVSKWETAESYPDITLLPKLARLFEITVDALLCDAAVSSSQSAVEYNAGFALSDLADHAVLDHGNVKACSLVKREDGIWEVHVHMVSEEENFPFIMQKCLRPGVLVDMYSCRWEDGKIVSDDRPNKHYVCREKVWEYHNTDTRYLHAMLREQVQMGLISEEDLW